MAVTIPGPRETCSGTVIGVTSREPFAYPGETIQADDEDTVLSITLRVATQGVDELVAFPRNDSGGLISDPDDATGRVYSTLTSDTEATTVTVRAESAFGLSVDEAIEAATESLDTGVPVQKLRENILGASASFSGIRAGESAFVADAVDWTPPEEREDVDPANAKRVGARLIRNLEEFIIDSPDTPFATDGVAIMLRDDTRVVEAKVIHDPDRFVLLKRQSGASWELTNTA